MLLEHMDRQLTQTWESLKVSWKKDTQPKFLRIHGRSQTSEGRQKKKSNQSPNHYFSFFFSLIKTIVLSFLIPTITQ